VATRIETRKSGGFSALLLLILLFAAIFAVAVPLAPELVKNHSDAKHGDDARAARLWIAGHGRHCKWECPDGRTRYACRMDDGKWALMVLEGMVEVTAFVTGSQDYVQAFIAGCENPWHYSHP
jgi:hypothetical protein